MKKVLLTLVFGLFFVAFTTAQTATIAKETKEFIVKKEKATDYACPMDCEKGKTYDKEGSCPVCKMDLKATKSAKKAKGCCPTTSKAKSDCGSKKAKSSCDGDKKAKKSDCGSKKGKSDCGSKKKSSCGGKK